MRIFGLNEAVYKLYVIPAQKNIGQQLCEEIVGVQVPNFKDLTSRLLMGGWIGQRNATTSGI